MYLLSSCFQSGYLQKEVSGVHGLGKHQSLVFFRKNLGVPLKSHAVGLFIVGLVCTHYPEILALTQYIIIQKILINLCCKHHLKLPRQSYYCLYSLLNGDLSNVNLSERFDGRKTIFHLQRFSF